VIRSNADDRRVVITGMGLVSPLGNSLDALAEALAAGRSGVGPLKSLPVESLPVHIGAEARDFRGAIDDFGPLPKDRKKAIRKGLKVMCRESQMGVAASQLALTQAGIAAGQLDPQRCGIVFGSDYMLTLPEEFTESVRRCGDAQGAFDYSRWATEGISRMQPLWLLKYLPNMPASHIAIYNDLRGPNNSLTHREASANLAIGEAYHTIVRGSADRMVAGATGTRIHPMKTVHAAQTEQLADETDDPARASRPFDQGRTGMVLGEGSGAIVMEELGVARSRGATIYGEILGAGSSAVIGRDSVAQCDRALANAMRACLRAARMAPGEVGHVHAHGLGTVRADIDEARAIGDVFGPRAATVAVTALKSYFGNLGAGSGMIELIASLLAFCTGHLPPVLNYETPDPACPVAAVTTRDVPAGTSFLNLSTTPQGQASAVLVGIPPVDQETV